MLPNFLPSQKSNAQHLVRLGELNFRQRCKPPTGPLFLESSHATLQPPPEEYSTATINFLRLPDVMQLTLAAGNCFQGNGMVPPFVVNYSLQKNLQLACNTKG